jgi:hypothetical protein
MNTHPTTRPVILLDIDGVIFADRPQWDDAQWVTATADGMAYHAMYSPNLVDLLKRLAAASGADLTLCSTWCVDPDDLLRVLECPIPSAFGREAWVNIRAAKLAAAQAVVDAGRPLVWIDDEAIPAGFGAGNPNVLAVAPRAGFGLSPLGISKIGAFLSQVTETPGAH